MDIPFKYLLDTVNFENRWMYSGSETEPPCTVGTVYHVVEGVLPISEKHYKALIETQMAGVTRNYFDADGAN